MRRHALRLGLTAVLALVGGALGLATALAASPTGRALLARVASAALTGLLRGQVSIGAVGGSFFGGITFRDLEIRDEAGRPFARLPRVLAEYKLSNILAGRMVLDRLVLVEPYLVIVKRRSGRTNLEEILRLGEGPGGGTPPLVEFRRLLIVSGNVEVRTPWNPPPAARTPAAVAEALGAERAREGREISPGPEGLERVIRLENLTGGFPRLTVSTPDRRPISVEVDTLAMDVSDPPVIVRDLAGRLEVRGDTLAFDIARAVLPGTELSGAGLVHWEAGPLRYDFRLAAPRADLEDIRWITDALPAMTGRAQVAASSPAPGRNVFTLDDLALDARDGSEVTGRLTVAVDDGSDDLGLDDLALVFRDVDLVHFKGFLDTIPLDGRLTGPVQTDGRMSDLAVRVDWAFADARLPGAPVSRLAGSGRVRLGGEDGLTFRGFGLSSSDLWLPTVREVAPTVVLEGRLAAVGRLDGPWRAATFTGTAVHRDGARPASRVEGTAFLDIRGAESFLRAELAVAPLDFEGIRAGFPTFPARGAVAGRVALEGTTARMRIVSELDGDVGHLETDGWFAIDYPERWGGDSGIIRFRGLDLAALTAQGPSTRLAGTLVLEGLAGTGRVPDGRLTLALGSSSVSQFRFDSLNGVVSVRDTMLLVDRLLLAWPQGQLLADGSLGWRRGRTGTLRVGVEAATLRPFDELAHAMLGMEVDSLSLAEPLRGSLTGTATLEGSLDSLTASADVALQDAGWREAAFPAAELTLDWQSGTPGALRLDASAVDLRWGNRRFTDLRLALDGRPDSLGWAAGAGLGEGSSVAAGGVWQGKGLARFTLEADSLTLVAGGHPWALQAPVTLVRADSAVTLTPVHLAAVDGAGVIRTEGNPPFGTPGALRLELIGVRLADAFSLMQRDTAVSGVLDAELLVGGTRLRPTFGGSASLADLTMRDFRAPFVQGVINYEDRILDANLLLWKTGTRVLTVRAALPLDLAFAAVPERRLPGPLEVAARADSVDLGIVEAFTPSLRRVRGLLNADVAVEGEWSAPRLRGTMALDGGAASVPGLGVTFDGIIGRASFGGDSMQVDSLVVRGGEGRLVVDGAVRFADLTRPVLDLRLRHRDFRAIDVRSYLTLDATGELSLTGPVFGATLRGQLRAERGQLYFADLVMKDIVNLEDPANADLIDTTLIRTQGLGAAFQSRFLDSLRITDLQLTIGDDFWLRSNEANIQVDGLVRVNKVRQDYRFDGTFNARRGTYALNLGFATRAFTVKRGTVRYFGTPDLNAALDLEAEHVVRPIEDPDDILVTARIRGTLLAPELSLTSDVRPPLTETDIVSYLMFGRPSSNLASGGAPGTSERLALDAGLSVLSSELERTLISDLGFPVDFIQIRPAVGASGSGAASGVTELRAGWQVGRQWFLTFNAGFCGLSQFSYNSVGASVEYRFQRHWRAQLSVEPLLACVGGRQVDPLSTTGRYQVGLDLFWEKEY
jgi:translocation and assembly module TamB